MNRTSSFWGLVLIALGAVFLLNNLGLINVNLWALIGPSFLIALGVWFLWTALFAPRPTPEHVVMPLEGARRARLVLKHGAGQLNLSAGNHPGSLFEGDFTGGLDLSKDRRDDLWDVSLSVPSSVFPFGISPGATLDWNMTVARDLPISIDLSGGANESRIDLRELRVSDLHLSSGASSTELYLPANAGHTRVRIETGAASVRVYVPTGVEAMIRSRSGLSSVEIDPGRFPAWGDGFRSPGYDSAANRVDIDIQAGVGSVEVK